MTKLEILDKKLALRNQCAELIKNGESEARKLNSVEEAKLTELRKQMADCDAEIAKIDEQLEEEKRVADTQKKNIEEKRNTMENKFSLIGELRSRVEKGSNEPIKMNLETRAFTVTGDDGAQGGATVQTNVEGLLTPLYSNNVLSKFTILKGLEGNVALPRMDAGHYVTWKGEIETAGSYDASIAAVTLMPKRLTAKARISKQLIYQSNSNIEEVVRTDLQNAMIQKLQETILGDGAGDANTPAGLFADADSLTSVTFANLCDVEQAVEDANVSGATSYIISPLVKNKTRQVAKASGQGGFLYESGELMGQDTVSTTAAKGIVYGQLSDAVLASWGQDAEITVDPYTAAGDGEIILTINTFWDFQKRRPNTIVAKKVTK